MKLKKEYKSEVYYFALNSMLRDYASKERCSKRAKKQFDFVRSFIDSKDADEVKKSVRGTKNGRSI